MSIRPRTALPVKMWQTAALILAIPGFGLIEWMIRHDSPELTLAWWLAVAVLSAGLLYAALFCQRHGRQVSAAHARLAIARDGRAPVLYLHSFSEADVHGNSPKSICARAAAFLGVHTEEEQLAQAISEIGPFVAVGKPGSALPDIATAQIYFGERDWSERVAELMAKSRLVLFHANESTRLWGEVKRTAENAGPEKLILLLSLNKKKYVAFCQQALEFLPYPLPAFAGGHTLIGRRTWALLYFDTNWTPYLTKIRKPFSLSIRPVVVRFQQALQPVIKHHRLTVTTLPKPSLLQRLVATIPGILLVLGLLAAPGHLLVEGLIEDHAVAHSDLGLRLYEKNNFAAASSELNKALRLNPKLAEAHNNLGLLLRGEHDTLGALSQFAEAVRLDPGSASAHNNLGLLYSEISATSADMTRLLFDKKRGVEYHITGDSAIAEFRQALRLKPEFSSARQNLANTLVNIGDFDGAIGEYNELIRLQPDSGTLHNSLGLVLEKEGRQRDALLEFTQARQLAPNDPQIKANYQRLSPNP